MAVRGRSAKEIDQLQLMISDGEKSAWTPLKGGNGGDPFEWQLMPGEFVKQVELRCGTRLDSITFITNTMRRSPQYGRNGGTPHTITI
jgi:hypothetical protein